jgi:hypothetical protein
MKQTLPFGDEVYGLGAGIFFLGYFLFEVPSTLLLEDRGAQDAAAQHGVVARKGGFVSAESFRFAETAEGVGPHSRNGDPITHVREPANVTCREPTINNDRAADRCVNWFTGRQRPTSSAVALQGAERWHHAQPCPAITTHVHASAHPKQRNPCRHQIIRMVPEFRPILPPIIQ